MNNSTIPECVWCAAEIEGQPFKNRRGEQFCTKYHRAASNRALKRFFERTEPIPIEPGGDFHIGLDISTGLYTVTTPMGEVLHTEVQGGFKTPGDAKTWVEENRNYLNH